MIIQLQKSLIDSIQGYSSLKYYSSPAPTAETVGIVVGLVLLVLFIICVYIFIAYFFPWWLCYDRLCVKCVAVFCCNCIRCYFYCPCMDKRARDHQAKQNKNSKVFVQDLLAAPDGSIIHLSDIRPMNAEYSNDISSGGNFRNISESNLI